MSQTPFSIPLYLKLHPTENFEACTPADALRYLERHWAGARTAPYRQARVLCRAADDGLVDAEIARSAVEDAARRNGLIAERGELDGSPLKTGLGMEATAEDDISDSDFVCYYRAKDIVDDPELAPSRKKALLAYWASDANAVPGAPGLRCIRGVTVTIDSLFAAMDLVDREIDYGAMVVRGNSTPRASR